MKNRLHIAYITFVIISFMLGWYFSSLRQDDIESPLIALKTPVTEGHSTPIAPSLHVDSDKQSAASLQKQPCPVVVAVKKTEPLTLASERQLTTADVQNVPSLAKPEVSITVAPQQAFYQQLTQLASKSGVSVVESNLSALESNGDIYQAIEQQLLVIPMDNSERLDLIDEYFTEHTENISPEFIVDMIHSAHQMEATDQTYVLELIQSYSKATRSTKDTAFRKTLIDSILPFKYSENKNVRYATLMAISDVMVEEKNRERALEYFLNDSSEVIRAQALVKLYQFNHYYR